jgi:hypothetical protein
MLEHQGLVESTATTCRACIGCISAELTQTHAMPCMHQRLPERNSPRAAPCILQALKVPCCWFSPHGLPCSARLRCQQASICSSSSSSRSLLPYPSAPPYASIAAPRPEFGAANMSSLPLLLLLLLPVPRVLRRRGVPREEEEGLQGVFKRLRRNGHQLEKRMLRTAQLRLSLKRRLNPRKTAPV